MGLPQGSSRRTFAGCDAKLWHFQHPAKAVYSPLQQTHVVETGRRIFREYLVTAQNIVICVAERLPLGGMRQGSDSAGVGRSVRLVETQSVSLPCSTNSRCLPRADTWVRPYDDIPTQCANRFFGVLVEYVLFSINFGRLNDKMRRTISFQTRRLP